MQSNTSESNSSKKPALEKRNIHLAYHVYNIPSKPYLKMAFIFIRFSDRIWLLVVYNSHIWPYPDLFISFLDDDA